MTAAPIEVHYWASARSAAGVASDVLEVEGPITLAEVVRRAVGLHPGTRLPDVLQICSTLVGDRPVNAEDPGSVLVDPGASVEFLPPFAGG
jgi:molybdopterin synthase sulfur carrier subunit